LPYLIDGNNLLGSWGGPRHGGEDRRDEVVRRVADLCRQRGMRATIVFDGAPLRSEWSQQEIGPVSVRVPPPGGDADGVIREIVDRSPHPRDWIVVTSDKPLYSYVRTRGARALQTREWNALAREAAAGAEASRPKRQSTEKPDVEADVEGWLRRFGDSDRGDTE
jgi:predicted RNA-binding protein with PIN domain